MPSAPCKSIPFDAIHRTEISPYVTPRSYPIEDLNYKRVNVI